MTKYQPDWIFSMTLQFAVAVCLSTLAFALAMDVAPLTALWRSGLIFVAFVSLGWTVSLVWQVPELSEAPVESETETSASNESS